jgi:hypothetical protein
MLEVYYEIPGSVNSTSNCSFTKFISNFGANFTASFTIIDQVVASNTGPYCVGETIQLNSNSATSPNWSGPVSFSNTNQNPTRPSATEAMSGLYTLTSTLSNGCSQNATTVVSVSTSASATNDGALCVGQTLILASSSGTSYSWLGPNSFTSSVQNPTVSASATAAMAGTYNVSIVGACGASGGVVDNFSDGNFTVNPVWTVQQGGIVSSSNFLKGNNTDTDDIISTPSTQIYGTWHFDYRFHTTAFTSSGDQFVAFFITSTNAGLQTSNGYYVYVESSGQLLLRRRNGGSAATTIITSSISGTSELNSNWHTIKVIRGFSGQFELYFDGVLKGIGTDNTYTTSTHLGPWIHGKFATDNHEVDNISCSPPATATTTVVVNTAPSITSKTGTICSGNTYTMSTASPDVVTTGTTYSWSFTANPNITGATTGTAQSSFTQTLTNTSGLPQTIVYAVTPTVGSCSGTPFIVTITVNPGPSITPMTATICSGQAFSVTPVNGTNGTVPDGTTYTWSAPVMTGATGGTAQATALTSISQTLANNTASNGTAAYTVTATLGTCSSTFTVTVTVTVLPPLVAGTVQGISSGGGGPGHLVISQVYGGGGNASAPYMNDYVEIFNPTASSVTLIGWSVQYASAAGLYGQRLV